MRLDRKIFFKFTNESIYGLKLFHLLFYLLKTEKAQGTEWTNNYSPTLYLMKQAICVLFNLYTNEEGTATVKGLLSPYFAQSQGDTRLEQPAKGSYPYWDCTALSNFYRIFPVGP
jgi:hypothetical protein